MATSVTSLPAIMRHYNWRNGAGLMESWFSRKPTAAPHYDTPDLSTIRMDWIMGFERARTVYDQIFKDRVWQNTAARGELAKLLKKKGRVGKPRGWFGDINLAPPTLEADYINYRTVGFDFQDLDGLTAALGNFTFRIVVAGEAESLPSGEMRVYVWQVGVYVKDSYDFNGDQSLGYWDDADNSVSMTNWFSGTTIENEDFRNWRAANGKGGDFLVYSDVRKTMLKTADVFTVK